MLLNAMLLLIGLTTREKFDQQGLRDEEMVRFGH
jgi:hypothetical protein